MNIKKATIGIFLFFLLVGSILTVSAAITGVTAPTEVFLGASADQARATGIVKTFDLVNSGAANITGVSVAASGVATKFSLLFSTDGTTYTSSLSGVTLVGTTALPSGITTLYVKGNITEDTDSGAQDLGTITVTSGAESAAFPLKIDTESKLLFKEVTAEYGDEEVTSLDDGDSFNDVRPGDTLTFTVEVENKYTDNEDISFENVEITVEIQELDDGDDEEKTSADFTLKETSETSKTFTFDIPENVDEGDYDIVITLVGDADLDSGSAEHEDEITLKMTVEKEENDVRIASFSSDKTVFSCDRNAILNLKLENHGSREQDEVRLVIKNEILNVDYEKKDIELSNELGEDDSEFSVTVPIEIDSKAPADKYNLRAQVYFEETIIDDLKDLAIEIKDCGTDIDDKTTTDTTDGKTDSKNTGTQVTDFTRPSTEKSGFSSVLGLVTVALFGGLVITSILLYRSRKI